MLHGCVFTLSCNTQERIVKQRIVKHVLVHAHKLSLAGESVFTAIRIINWCEVFVCIKLFIKTIRIHAYPVVDCRVFVAGVLPGRPRVERLAFLQIQIVAVLVTVTAAGGNVRLVDLWWRRRWRWRETQANTNTHSRLCQWRHWRVTNKYGRDVDNDRYSGDTNNVHACLVNSKLGMSYFTVKHTRIS